MTKQNSLARINLLVDELASSGTLSGVYELVVSVRYLYHVTLLSTDLIGQKAVFTSANCLICRTLLGYTLLLVLPAT